MRQTSNEKGPSFLSELISVFKSSIVVFVMGFARIIVHNAVDYQSHVSEYGIHWNFYTTIFVVNFYLVFIRDIRHSVLFATLIMSLYEISLTVFDLRDYIFYAPRSNLFNGNREGIFSSIGYLSILLISMSIGK